MIKNRLKDDIKFMLTSLVSKIESSGEDYNSLIAEIYSELDNLSVVDLYVTREYIKDSINSLTAENNTEKTKKGMVAGRLKVISDDVGNFYVVSEENGQEKIVMQFNDKAKADEYVRNNQGNAAMAATPEDELDDDVNEDLTSIPKDDLPDTEVDEKDTDEEEGKISFEEEELDDEEEDVDQETLDKIDELIERADHLISAIDNSIDVVPDLDAITDLVNIKVTIQDKVDELNSTDPSSPDLDEAMEALHSELEEYESSALDLINKNAPGREETVEEQGEEDEIVEENVVVEEDSKFSDKVTDEDTDTSDDEETDLDSELNDDEEFEEPEVEDLDEFEDRELDEFEDEELDEENINELINDLLSSLEDIEEKVEEVKETLNQDEYEEELDSEEELDEDIDKEELGEEELDNEVLDEEELDSEEEDILNETEDEKSLESSVLNPFDWESLEDGEKKDSDLESDTPTDKLIPENGGVGDKKKSEISNEDKKLIPEDKGVQKVGRKEPDKKAGEELPLDGTYPLEAEADAVIPKNKGIGDKKTSEVGKEDKNLIPKDDGVVNKEKSEVGKEDKNLIPKDDGIQKIGRKKPDKKTNEELPLEGKNPLAAKELLPDGTEITAAWISYQLEKAGIKFTKVTETAPGEFEIVSDIDTKYGKDWDKYEADIYKTLANAGWRNEDSIFIV